MAAARALGSVIYRGEAILDDPYAERFLGPRFAERRYRRRHGRAPKHLVGRTLYPVHIGPTLRLVRSLRGVEIIDARPRYYPRWCRPVVRVPWLREVLT